MNLKRIRLELAPTADFPAGSPRHGYDLVAPLYRRGRLDPAGWSDVRAACTVRRFWGTAPVEHGTLTHRRDGQWVFSYGPGDDDDEAILHLEKQRLALGELVTITEHDGIARPFRVVEVTPAITRD